jgi:uncharacterized ion transporter superfamily protein YfcC
MRNLFHRIEYIAIAFVFLVGGLAIAVHRVNVVDRDLCATTQHTWDTSKELIDTLTQHSSLATGLRGISSETARSLEVQIQSANDRKDQQHRSLDTKLGKRPKC